MKRTVQEAVSVAVTLVMALAAGLCLNAWYQADQSRQSLSNKVKVSAFMKQGAVMAPAQILEAVSKVSGSGRVTMVSPETALDKAMAESPAIKDILVTGENPFTPYFVIVPARATLLEAKRLKEAVAKIDGIDEVAYDYNVFAATEKLNAFVMAYQRALTALAALLLLAALARTWVSIKTAGFQGRRYAMVLLKGCAAGLAAIAVSSFFGDLPVLSLPSGLLWLLVPGAVVAQFAHDHE